MTSSARRGAARSTLGLLLALMLALAGWFLLRDRPGLRLELYPLTIDCRGEPLLTETRDPRITELGDLGISTRAPFCVRWRGWLFIEEEGRHRFAIEARDTAYLTLDGERLLATGDLGNQRRDRARTPLTPGYHPIEVLLVQLDHEIGRSDDVLLDIEWKAPGSEPASLSGDVLYSRRPLPAYRLARRVGGAMGPLATRALGAALLLSALVCLRLGWPPRASARRIVDRLPSWLGATSRSRRWLLVAAVVGLFLAVWAKAFYWSAATFGGDDVAYIRAALVPDHQGWYFNRMVHVYLLKLFVTIFGWADAFLGSRMYGAFAFTTILAALTVSVRALGPGLQLRTLAVVLFLVFSQPGIVGVIGVALADNTVMMLVTVAVAVYLHGKSREESPRSRHEWHALALGALTLAAFKSKETGVILLFFPLLMLWTGGRIDWRRFGRRLAYWLAGLAVALVALMIADGLWLDDFFWAVRPQQVAGPDLFYADELQFRSPGEGWLNVLFEPGEFTGELDLRNLFLFALLTPLVAAARKAPIERRFFYLFPVSYLFMLIVVYSRLQNAGYSSRTLSPILPATCLVAGALLFHLGIERPTWRELLAPRVFLPLLGALAVIFLVVTPYRVGLLEARDVIPAAYAERYGWAAEHFLEAILVPALALVGLSLASLFFHRRRARLAVALVAILGLTAASASHNVRLLERRSSVEYGRIKLYPLRAFDDEIEALGERHIHVSIDVIWRLGMLGRANNSVATAYFRRPMGISAVRELPADFKLAIASRSAYDRWRVDRPGLETGAQFDDTGQFVLLRPAAATAPSSARPGQPRDPAVVTKESSPGAG